VEGECKTTLDSIWRYVPLSKMEGNGGPIFIHFWKVFTGV